MENSNMEYMEIWNPVMDFEGSYEISSMGRVRSLDRTVKGHVYKSQIIKTRSEIWGPSTVKRRNKEYGRYMKVDLYKKGRRYTKNLARLIWESFNGPIPPGMEIDHINGDKGDNRLDNLRCCTHRVNVYNPVTRARVMEGIRKRKNPA